MSFNILSFLRFACRLHLPPTISHRTTTTLKCLSTTNRILANPHFVITNPKRFIKPNLNRNLIEERVLAICENFDKIQADKLTLDSDFLKDLGLDSLDHIEIIMEIENEFWLEIPDVDAENLPTPRAVIEHISNMALKAEPIE